jgi:integrase
MATQYFINDSNQYSFVDIFDPWKDLSDTTIQHALNLFLETLTHHTKIAYSNAFKKIFGYQILDGFKPLSFLVEANLENLLDSIQSQSIGVSVSTKQNRAAAFISFTRFLSRKTGGKIRQAIPNREKSNPTFRTDRHKAKTEALNELQCRQFFQAMNPTKPMDILIAKMLLQGAKRLNEVLEAKIENINWEKGQISFVQSKTTQRDKVTVITYSAEFMADLKKYLGDRESGLIFISKKGNKITKEQVYKKFVSVGEKAGIPFKVHPHTFRTTAITRFVGMGISADKIAKVSGHSSVDQVIYYDKTSIEDNITKQISLI